MFGSELCGDVGFTSGISLRLARVEVVCQNFVRMQSERDDRLRSQRWSEVIDSVVFDVKQNPIVGLALKHP